MTDFAGRFQSKCQVCTENAQTDYVKFTYQGFELMYMMCKKCFGHVHLAGLRHLRVVVGEFRDELMKEARRVANEGRGRKEGTGAKEDKASADDRGTGKRTGGSGGGASAATSKQPAKGARAGGVPKALAGAKRRER